MTTQAITDLPRNMAAAASPATTSQVLSHASAANPVTVTGPAVTRFSPASPAIGQRMPDGTVYAGVSPDTGKPMYTTPKDTGLCASWHNAIEHAAKLNIHGHNDWRVPTKFELNVLFNNSAAIGHFDEAGSYPAGWYWSSSQYYKFNACLQRFSDGSRGINFKNLTASLRCVRG